ncbi:hypothetical protein BOO23_06375 [Vibrio navarrensis]|nr:hypothetical protein [Vibrio navarrensis]
MLIRLMCTFIPAQRKRFLCAEKKCGHVTAHKKRPKRTLIHYLTVSEMVKTVMTAIKESAFN